MSESQDRQEKQAYLRSVILEDGYSVKRFTDYLESAKSDGSNIDNWTLDELKTEVANYKRYVAPTEPSQPSVYVPANSLEHKAGQSSEDETSHEPDKSEVVPAPSNEEKLDEEKSMETAEAKKEPLEDEKGSLGIEGKEKESLEMAGEKKEPLEKTAEEKTKPLDVAEEGKKPLEAVEERKKPSEAAEEEKKEALATVHKKESLGMAEEKKADAPKESGTKSKAIKTVVTMKSEMALRGRDALIVAVKLVNPGFFSRNYLAYVIETPEERWQVARKEADFYDLRTILVKLYPGYAVPRLPKDPLKTTDPAQATTRRQSLQHFLNQVLKHHALITCKFVRSFLAEANEKEYKKQKKLWESFPPPAGVADCVTPEGIAVTSFDHSLSKYCLRLAEVSSKLKEKFKTLKLLNNRLAEQLSAVAVTMGNIAFVNSEISSLYGDTSEVGMSSVFRTMEGLFANFSGESKQLETRIRDHLANAIKGYNKEIGSIEDLLSRWRASKSKTEVMIKRLKEKKELTFTTKSVNDWQLNPECKLSTQVLLNCKKLAFQEMLSAETAEVEKHKDTYGYFSNKIKEEFRRVCAKNVAEFVARQVAVSRVNVSELDNVKRILESYAKQLCSVLEFKDPTVVCGGSCKEAVAQAGVHDDCDDEL